MGKNVRVVPAILTDSPAALANLVRQAESFTDYAQLDIMDGKFVPSTSITGVDFTALHTTLKWEAHLMVLQPEDYLEAYRQAGARKFVFHYEAVREPAAVIRQIKKLGMGAGLAVNPETMVKDIAPLAGLADSVLFMAVHPGFYGAKFIPEVLGKIREFKRAFPAKETGIDGGIKESNIREIAQTGLDVIYVGSAIFLQPDPAASYKKLASLAAAA